MAILSVNAGSSSLKFAVHPIVAGEVQTHVLAGNVQGLEPGGNPRMDWTWDGLNHNSVLPLASEDPFDGALVFLRTLLSDIASLPSIQAVSHRVVHGGQDFHGAVRATSDVLLRLERLQSLAPLHQPHNLAGIRAFAKIFPEAAQIACFDTAFHASMGELASAFALPVTLTSQSVRRYGFHGLSYEFILHQLQGNSARANDRVLMAHLGNGASVCAARGGVSIATSMGFSALDGLVMGTRSGSLDAGVLLFLLEQGWDHRRLEKLLYKESGLLGVSGISADMRTLRSNGSAQAQFAIDLFAYRLMRECGAMVACLQGLDAIALSGGIGEHDVVLRSTLMQQMAWMGIAIDEDKNHCATGESVAAIHAPHSTAEVWVIPTDEGFIAARQAWALLC